MARAPETIYLGGDVRFKYTCPETDSDVTLGGNMLYLATITDEEGGDDPDCQVGVVYPVIKIRCPCGEVHIFADDDVPITEDDLEIEEIES